MCIVNKRCLDARKGLPIHAAFLVSIPFYQHVSAVLAQTHELALYTCLYNHCSTAVTIVELGLAVTYTLESQPSSRVPRLLANYNKLPVFCKQEGNHRLVGLSRAVVLRVCAQQAQQLQAFKLARWAHTQLQALRLPSLWQVHQPHHFVKSQGKHAAGILNQAGHLCQTFQSAPQVQTELRKQHKLIGHSQVVLFNGRLPTGDRVTVDS